MKIFAALLPLAALASSPAQAATVIEELRFTAVTNGPIQNHSGTFSFSYNSVGVFNPTLRSIDFSLGGFAFTLANTIIGGSQSFDRPPQTFLTLGGATNLFGISPDNNDFFLSINRNTGASSFGYVLPGNRSTFFSSQANVAAVPEPATWLMMILGLGFVGGAMRAARGRQRLSVSYS